VITEIIDPEVAKVALQSLHSHHLGLALASAVLLAGGSGGAPGNFAGMLRSVLIRGDSG
jgi:hypothetical protein